MTAYSTARPVQGAVLSKRERYVVTETYDVCEFARDVLGLKLWPAQEVALRTLYGLPFTAQEQHDIFATLTADVYGEALDYIPGTELSELACILGRRSGKTKGIIAPLVCYEAMRDWSPWLNGVTADTEYVYLIMVSVGMDQAKKLIQQSVLALLANVPGLAAKIETYQPGSGTGTLRQSTNADQVVLKNHNVILSRPANSTAGRGYPTPVIVLDEVAHYFKADGSTRQDKAVVDSLEPGQLDFPLAKLAMLSSPGEKRGVLWDAFRTAGDERDARVVLKGSTEVCRPDANEPHVRRRLERAKRRNPVTYAVEYGAEFAASISGLLDRESIDACVRPYARLPWREGIEYTAAMDPSGGGDAWGLAVGHWEQEDRHVVIDYATSLTCGRVGGRLDLDSIVAQIREALAAYRLGDIISDQYEAESLAALLRIAGVQVWRQDWSLKTRQEHGIKLKAIVDQGRLRLPNEPAELVDDLLSLQRVYLDSGAWTIKAKRSGGRHGDLADCVQAIVDRVDRGAFQHDEIGGRFGV